jgi:hypothetical protein
MPTATALQMPVRSEAASPVGRKLYRKQILKQGTITYKGRTLDFDRPYLEKLVKHFRAGAYEQVPFVLADGKNLHNEDPERFRGEVKGLELTPDGVDAIVELSDKGVELLEENPRLGVSARIVETAGPPGEGLPPVAPAVRHLCGTLDGRITGLTGWEAMSDLSNSYAPGQIVDLTTAEYQGTARMPETKAKNKLTDEQITELKGLDGDAFTAKLAELLEETGDREAKEGAGSSTSKQAKNGEGDKPKSLLQRLLGKDDAPSDEDLELEFEKLLADAGDDDDAEPSGREAAAAGASLSAEDREAIDLARAEATTARKELAEQRFKTERAQLIAKGIPPVAVDLAKPLLMGDAPVIDLAGGAKADPAEIARGLLKQLEGTIDFTVSGSDADSDEATEAKEMAKRWKENPA